MSAPLLSCRGLTRRFGGLVALDGLDLTVEEGSVLGLIGPNGSGKTTFFNVLTGLFPPSDGEISFAGGALSGATPQAIYRAGITRTFQRSRLCLELSIFDNLAIGAHQRLEHGLWFNLLRRRALAQQADATAAAARELLELFDPPLASRLFEPMSGTAMIDRRRVEICRALMSRPRLLLLDEPSAGMTGDETTRLMDDLLEVRRRFGDLTVVLIEHEMAVIERVTDRCVVLNYGKKLCEGTFAEVASDPEVRRAYLGLT
ncbi:MAG TPA: ABC transporter ATP-binding protein [Myxococcaceae bacterium]|nr:ABC transporter ATP-binding protein [Myxococcaceae bacterium]